MRARPMPKSKLSENSATKISFAVLGSPLRSFSSPTHKEMPYAAYCC